MQNLLVKNEAPSFRRETRTTNSAIVDMMELGVKRKRSIVLTPNPHETDSPRTKKHKKAEND